ncbi:MAG: hypothetical protein KBE65_20665 [Phycisphaerae bacterium]|nr:hypothetical protein [Phycisphaerae bacterium]
MAAGYSIIGVEDYRDKVVSRVEFACANATALAQRLREGWEFDHVRVLADNSGDDESLLVNIGTTLGAAVDLCAMDLFLFFFGGHGVEKNGRGQGTGAQEQKADAHVKDFALLLGPER